MPIRVSQQQFVSNWQQGTQTKQANYAAGVQKSADWAGPTVSALSRAVAGVQEAFSSGRTATAINNLGTTGWRNATVGKQANWLQGVTSQMGIANMTNGAAKLYNMLGTALQVVDATPRGSLAQNLARANAFATSMYNQKRGL